MTNYRIVQPPSEKARQLIVNSFEVAALKLGVNPPSWHLVAEDSRGHIRLPVRVRGCTWPDSAGFVRVLINRGQSEQRMINTIFHETKHLAMIENDYRHGQITDRAIGEGAANFFANAEAPTGNFVELMRQLSADRAAFALKNRAPNPLQQIKRPRVAATIPTLSGSRSQRRTVRIFNVDRREWRLVLVESTNV